MDEAEIQGRDEEHLVLVSKLLREDETDGDRDLTVISVVGMGGLGKTTLVQRAYNDDTIKERFEKRIWVCVSDPFDEIQISKAIIEAVQGSAPNVNELDSLHKMVANCVEGKRFLLVLDDVWNKDEDKWDKLKRPLTCGASGSRVLVTTRKEEVVMTMKATSNMITLELLSEENCWSIFKRLAFLERKEDDKREFEDIGRKIASKCKGLPLVARMLGSLMRFKKTKAQWEKVMHNDWWYFKDVEGIFTPFLVSYYDLSAVEKQCFLYCSIFPKDHRIRRDELIELWMSQNYLSGDSYDEGQECFDNLAMRSFFQNFEKHSLDGSITHCMMHDIVHDFAQFLNGKEYIVMGSGSVTREMQYSPTEKARHLTIQVKSIEEFPTIDYRDISRRKVRTVYNVSTARLISVDYSLFEHLTRLRSLRLSDCKLEKVPDSIGRLIHLRYLNISKSYDLVELPETLCDLCNLQTLKLKKCSKLKNLPEGIGRLANLRHLYVRGCSHLPGFPKGIGKLKHLRYLDSLFVPKRLEEFLDVDELKIMPNLHFRGQLRIHGCEYLKSKDRAEKLGLKNIGRDVTHLTLDFGEDKYSELRSMTFEDENEVLEGLEPLCQNLELLAVLDFYGTKLSASWMSWLINLREIRMFDCLQCKVLPSCLGNLPSLEAIYIYAMTSLTEVGDEFMGVTGRENDPPRQSTPTTTTIFPKLKSLSFSFVEEWERWEGQVDKKAAVIMPCLISLTLIACPKLVVLPEFLATVSRSLKHVEVAYCARWWGSRSGSEWDKISQAANIRIDGKPVKQDGVWIQADDDISE